MLSFVLTDIGDRDVIMSRPLSAVIEMDEAVPADSLLAVFPYTECRELKSVRVYDDAKLVFTGVIDEQSRIVSPQGAFLRIAARSLAALLLDNEAAPQIFEHPSARMLYDRYAREYGIAAADTDDASYFGELTIPKGTSRWAVIQSFCKACSSGTPHVTADGRLFMKNVINDGKIVFSDSGRGVVCTEISESIIRCEEISRVNIKLDVGGGYTSKIENQDVVDRGIMRERYVNAALTTMPVKCADAMLEKGRDKAYMIRLKTPCRLLSALGCAADVKSRDIGDKTGLYVSSIKYRLSSREESTEAVLKRRNV